MSFNYAEALMRAELGTSTLFNSQQAYYEACTYIEKNYAVCVSDAMKHNKTV